MNEVKRNIDGSIDINGTNIKDAKVLAADYNEDFTMDIVIVVKAKKYSSQYEAETERNLAIEESKKRLRFTFGKGFPTWKRTTSLEREEIEK